MIFGGQKDIPNWVRVPDLVREALLPVFFPTTMLPRDAGRGYQLEHKFTSTLVTSPQIIELARLREPMSVDKTASQSNTATVVRPRLQFPRGSSDAVQQHAISRNPPLELCECFSNKQFRVAFQPQ